MNKGVIISGVGHVGLILWAMLGGWLFAAQEVPEIKVVDVSMISNAQFDAMVSAAPAVPDVAPEAVTPPQPASEPVAEPPAEPDPAPETTPPVTEPAPAVETPPETAQPPEPLPEDPAPQPEPVPDPIAPPADVPQPIQVPRQTKAPRPRPAVKISDAPPEVAPDTPNTADQAAPETSDQPAPVEPLPAEPPAKPEETTPVVTPDPPAVVENAPVLAPTASKRPQTRSMAAVKPVETPVENQAAKDKAAADKAAQRAADQAAADKATAAKAARAQADQAAADQAAIDAAVAAATGAGPSSPPMTGGEIDGLRVAIKSCFNVGTLSTVASQTKVTVRLDVGQNRKPVSASIRMTGFEGGEEAAATQVFEVAKRAIIRCSKDGLPLPDDKFESWKDLELVFDPTGMRLR